MAKMNSVCGSDSARSTRLCRRNIPSATIIALSSHGAGRSSMASLCNVFMAAEIKPTASRIVPMRYASPTRRKEAPRLEGFTVTATA
jgi:hypothetical protein